MARRKKTHSTKGSRAAALAGVVTALLGASAGVALAVHYHSYNWVDHGIVHGSSNIDYSYFGRTLSDYLPPSAHRCGIGHTGRGLYVDITTAGDCDVWSAHYSNSFNECLAISVHAMAHGSTVRLQPHPHEAHNYTGGYGCPYNPI